VSDSTNEVVRYELDGPVAWVTIDRAEAGNALNAAVRTGLWEATHRFNTDSAAKVLVLTGAGERAFCAGADLREMADGAMEAPPPDFLPIFGRNVEVAKPTIAAVNGVAYAGGFLLTQMCDLVVAAEHARFAITEAKVGRGTPWAAPLPWLLAPRVALELLLTGEHLTAERAREIGLANRVVPVAELRATAQQLAETIAANAPLSVAAAKRTVYLSQPDVYAQADAIWDPVYRSADAQEGPRAFRDGRTPDWQGR
jgi:enoyl-CoA hydratase/carnithine racemase